MQSIVLVQVEVQLSWVSSSTSLVHQPHMEPVMRGGSESVGDDGVLVRRNVRSALPQQHQPATLTNAQPTASPPFGTYLDRVVAAMTSPRASE